MMNMYLILGALPAVVLASPPPHVHQTTSTVYATSVHTVTSCKPEVTNCPAKKGPVVVTEVVAVSTTVCAVTDVETSTRAPAGCSTATSVSDCVHTITKTAPAFVVTTKAPATTITKKVESVSTSTCVHTIPGKDKDQTVTTVFPTTVTKDTYETKYTDCVHTVTGATSLLVVTTAIPTTYTICPVKPTWGKPDFEGEGPKPTGSWPHPHPGKPDVEGEAPVKPTGSWGKPEVTGVAPVKPTGTGAWTHTTTGNKAVVTAGAAAFGASGAIKMLGAAAAAALLL
ncbi:hypothetical protein QBC39DRAFT_361397 [Podospora conica]|nr:hypothetical protein QBC39DRAFT_361397 [Schizothecium conicum]